MGVGKVAFFGPRGGGSHPQPHVCVCGISLLSKGEKGGGGGRKEGGEENLSRTKQDKQIAGENKHLFPISGL